MRTIQAWAVRAGLLAALTTMGCDSEQPAPLPKAEQSTQIPERQEQPNRTESSSVSKAETPVNDAPTDFEAARKKIEELEKSLPATETVLANQLSGADGLKVIGDKMLELGKTDDLTKMQVIFKSFKASQTELSELFGQQDADRQWPGYARNSGGFVTIAEKFTADIKAGRYDQIEVVELKAGEKLPPALERMLTALNGKTPAFELSLVNSQKPKDKKTFRPMIFVNGQWRYLMGLFTSKTP